MTPSTRPQHTKLDSKPGFAGSRLVPDQRAAGAEPVTARATLRWPNHPRAVCAADKLADCGHVSIIARGGRGFIHSGTQHAMIGAS